MAAVKPKRKNVSLENVLKQEEKKGNHPREIEINKIVPPKFHDRKYIDTTTIYELAESIKAEGLLYPILTRELPDGRFERMIGYRRIEAFKLLNREKIPAIVLKDISDEKAILMMITENLQRENISIYDETLALLNYVSVALNKPEKETIRLLTRFKNYSAHNIKELNHEDLKAYDSISQLLAKTGKITINTLVDRLNVLSLNSILQDSLSKGELSYTNAKILNKIKDNELLKEAVCTVVENSYSKRETAEYVKKILPEKEKEETKIKKISKINVDKLPREKKRKISELIDEILKIAEE